LNMDPVSEFLERSSPYVYSLNNPIIYIDKDGELPILINGRVASERERANQSYWTKSIVATILSSGIPNPGGEIHYVDGDRFYNGKTSRDYSTGKIYNIIERGGYLGGENIPANRYDAGYHSLGDREFKEILSKLERNSDSKIIERIQIYTHSRGAAFGAGYTKKLMEYISAYADQFNDPANVIDFVLNLAPHQSESISSPFGVDAYSINHTNDWLSGNKMGGLKAAFTSDEGKGGMVPEAHYITGFQNNLKAFTSSFLKGKTSQSVIDNFIKEMKDRYDIDVNVR